MRETVRFDPRFNGPPSFGNGGYIAGRLAERAGGGVEVRLRRPVPLGAPLQLEEVEEKQLRLFDGEQLIAETRPHSFSLALPPLPSAAEAAAAGAQHCPPPQSPFRACFVCGSDREPHDGLRVLAGPLGEQARAACLWTPHPDHARDDGTLPEHLIWSVLDCPGASAVLRQGSGNVLLGGFAVQVSAPVHAGRPHIVLAWHIASDGRKHVAGTALLTADAEACAVGKALWIEAPVPPVQ